MTDPFPAVGHRRSTAIAAMILGILLLLSPTSFGLWGTFVQEGFGQFNLPSLPGEDTTTPSPPEETGPSPPPQVTANGLTFLERGFMGSTLPTQGGSNENSHVVTGRFRIYVNESLVQRFVAEMNLAAIDGTTFHNITIEESSPHRFKLTESGNETTTTNATRSIPPVSSELRAAISLDGNVPITNDVPMTISIRGQVLAIEGIDIDEARITDTQQRNILSIIDGQSIYGTVLR
jgi:hypothetical protein